MDRDRFYELVDEARESSDATAPSADADDLGDVLERLDDDELVGFSRAFVRELVRLNEWRIRAAGHVATGGMGEDGFHYFRSWIVGKGRDAVDQAIDDPDGLADFLGDEDGEELENEQLEYGALELLEDRGLEVPDDDADVDDEPRGDEFDEESVRREYPRLSAWAAGTD